MAATDKSYVGKLVVMGSEPFTQIAVKVSGGETYVLGWTRDHKDLLSQQQQTVNVVGQEVKPLAAGGFKMIDAKSVTALNIEGDILTIQVEASLESDAKSDKAGKTGKALSDSLSLFIRPHQTGKWYVGKNDTTISAGKVGTLWAAFERMSTNKERPELSGQVKPRFVEVIIERTDRRTVHLRWSSPKYLSNVWRVKTEDGDSKVLLSPEFTVAFLELMRDADPQGWGTIAESYFSREKKP